MHRTQDLTVTDMFCGAGGSSIGVTAAGASVRLAMNHWPVAIDTHAANFPGVDHACVNVSACDPAYFPTTDILIASPECKAHTYSRGRRRAAQQTPLFDLTERDRHRREAEARSRATMFDVPRWAEHHRYAAVIVENVLEIFDWELIGHWLGVMDRLGYRWQTCSFNSMFFGGSAELGPRPPQSRDRVYIVFTRTTNPLPDLDYHPRAWCPRCDRDIDAVQVFNPGRSRGRYRQQYRYRCPACTSEAYPYVAPAARIIDWSLPCPPIGGRRRPLAASTRARIRAYLLRHGWGPALVKVTHTSRNGRIQVNGHLPRSVAEPLRAQTAQPELALTRTPFVDTARRNATGRPVGLPLTAVAAEGNHHALVASGPFIDTARADNMPRAAGLPLTTLATGNHHYLVFPERGYIVANDQPGWLGDADPLPLGVVTARDHHCLLVPAGGHVHDPAGTGKRLRRASQPLPTLTADTANTVVVPAGGTWNTDAQPAVWPLRTLTSRQANGLVRVPPDFLVPYYRTGTGRAAAEPSGAFTSKDTWALVAAGEDADQELEAFIDACGYRMLGPPEIGAGMAFPSDYQVTGTRDQQVAQYGNAVTPPVMTWIFRRVVESLA